MPRRPRKRGGVSADLRPVAGSEAFRNHTDTSHVHSQAATLLLIGSHLRGDTVATRARMEAAANTGVVIAAPALTEDAEILAFPPIRPSGERFSTQALIQLSAPRQATATKKRRKPSPADITANAERFYRDANSETAAALLHAALNHPQPLVRVAAASSYVDLAINPRPAIKVLEAGVGSKDLLVRDVAAYALANVDPKNPRLKKLLHQKRLRTRRKRSRTSTIIHGTWAASGTWWQPPSGDFWKYLHDNVDPNLYGAADRFGWTGGYSDAARADAGSALHEWVADHDLEGLDLYTHSHGGSVAMLASQAGTRIGKLVFLSCPVHWPKYMPDFDITNKAVSVRVHMDLVILADRGGQRFSDPRIAEHVLPLWFDHFATHDPANWQKYDVPGML